jgi:flagellar hook assembly protein FlgD
LSYIDSNGNSNYRVRIFNPSDNWNVVKDVKLDGTSYPGFASFFVANGYLYPYENYESGYMRRLNLNTGKFEEDWLSWIPYAGFYAWCYDWVNDNIYASVFAAKKSPAIYSFLGKYRESAGYIESGEIGPASKWRELSYNADTLNSTGSYYAYLFGYNNKTLHYDTLVQDVKMGKYALSSIDPAKYSKLKFYMKIIENSSVTGMPVRFSGISVGYDAAPEITLSSDKVEIESDSLLQGFPINISVGVQNLGTAKADSIYVKIYDENDNSVYGNKILNLNALSSGQLKFQIPTDHLKANKKYAIKILSENKQNEMFTYNNICKKHFYVMRDSLSPQFNITFDGQEIMNGDIISAKPDIRITLSDNSPLPLNDTSFFAIFLDGSPVSFKRDSLQFSFTGYPNNKATIKWLPAFKEKGSKNHLLEITAKDASGNYFDTTSYSVNFRVNSQDNIESVYNYPNPFKDDTYFTFQLSGNELPDQCRIKIYTVAGRLINEIYVASDKLKFGFNRIYWNGKDKDGSLVANGVYFYKIAVENKSFSKSVIQKLAKIK